MRWCLTKTGSYDLKSWTFNKGQTGVEGTGHYKVQKVRVCVCNRVWFHHIDQFNFFFSLFLTASFSPLIANSWKLASGLSLFFSRDIEQHMQRRYDGLNSESSRSDRYRERRRRQHFIILIGFVHDSARTARPHVYLAFSIQNHIISIINIISIPYFT